MGPPRRRRGYLHVPHTFVCCLCAGVICRVADGVCPIGLIRRRRGMRVRASYRRPQRASGGAEGPRCAVPLGSSEAGVHEGHMQSYAYGSQTDVGVAAGLKFCTFTLFRKSKRNDSCKNEKCGVPSSITQNNVRPVLSVLSVRSVRSVPAVCPVKPPNHKLLQESALEPEAEFECGRCHGSFEST